MRGCAPCCRFNRRHEGLLRCALVVVVLTLGSACAVRPEPPRPAEPLLQLAAEVIEARTPEARRAISERQRLRFEADPTPDNRLRLTLVRAFGAALAPELQEVRADLQALADGEQALSDEQRQLALIALVMVDERLRLGSQISTLQRQLDSLTEIEASLNEAGSGPRGPGP